MTDLDNGLSDREGNTPFGMSKWAMNLTAFTATSSDPTSTHSSKSASLTMSSTSPVALVTIHKEWPPRCQSRCDRLQQDHDRASNKASPRCP